MRSKTEIELLSEEYLKKLDEYQAQIDEIYKNGEYAIGHNQRKIKAIKSDKTITVDEQIKRVADLNEKIEKAKQYKVENAQRLVQIQKEATEHVENYLKSIIDEQQENYNSFITKEQQPFFERVKEAELKIKALEKETKVYKDNTFKSINSTLKEVNKLAVEEVEARKEAFENNIEVVTNEYNSKIENIKTLETELHNDKVEFYLKKSKLLKLLSEYHLARYFELSYIYGGKIPSALLKDYNSFKNLFYKETCKGFALEGDYKKNANRLQLKLAKIRSYGVNGVTLTKETIASTKKNDDISVEDKKKIIEELQTQLLEQIQYAVRNKDYVKLLEGEGIGLVEVYGKFNRRITILESLVSKFKVLGVTSVSKYAEIIQHKKGLDQVSYLIANPVENKDEQKDIVAHAKKSVNIQHKSTLKDISEVKKRVFETCKRNNHEAFLGNQSMMTSYRNGTPSLKQTIETKFHNYVYKFDFKQHLLKNCLYYIIVIFFLVCAIIEPKLVKAQSLLDILSSSSVRVFYSLGVAGLIVLAGTDLSIGRMIGLGMVLSTMVMQATPGSFSMFGVPINFSSVNPWLQIIIALIFAIVACTAFSAFSGFFTAKFKMHPFISTLGSQLIIYGLLLVATGGASTTVISDEALLLKHWGLSFDIGLIVYAIIAIAIVWFIWNKTKYGKSLFAVGGNQEAAAVSGINVFKITLLAFIMAGILYGFGSFFEGIRLTTASAGTGSGKELDAIAACVVGGISFNGGIGKISGVVVGTILFELLTSAFTFVGLRPELAFVMKGAVIIFAVTLDSLKYIKKK